VSSDTPFRGEIPAVNHPRPIRNPIRPPWQERRAMRERDVGDHCDGRNV